MLDRLGSAKPDEPYKDGRLEDITIQNLGERALHPVAGAVTFPLR